MKKLTAFCVIIITAASCNPKIGDGLRRNDLKRDVEMVTDKGTMVIRLSDSTPLHRNNFIKLVKEHYYDSVLFHRVIKNFMVQAGDPDSKKAHADDQLGNGGPKYKIPAEIRTSMFHRKGVIAAARTGDNVNPERASSGSQFYLVQGKIFTEAGLDSVENLRLKRKLPPEHRTVYKTTGGAPHLDQSYTIFGEVIKGEAVIDSIAIVPTSGRQGGDRPLQDVRIIRARLIKRKT
jgi:cyclophilin family peptidyl-prolyl cis-trans isomerase